MKLRASKLYQVFQKFIDETLKPMKTNEFDKRFPDLKLVSQEIENNIKQEFDKILKEKRIIEKLNKLDDLNNNKNLFKLDKNAFEFEPHDPENIRRSIVTSAKYQEILKLRVVLENLEKTNQELTKTDEEIQQLLFQECEKINETTQLLQKTIHS